MTTSRVGTVVRASLALAAGLAYPFLELAWQCRVGNETSEACAWGRALFPLTRWVEPVIVAPIVFTILTLWAHWRRRAHERSSRP